MANEVIGGIERALREKAAMDATRKFHQAMKDLLTPGYPVSSNKDEFSSEDFNELKKLLERFLKFMVIPKAQDMAVRLFVANYEQLVAELPALQETAYQEGQEDARQGYQG